MFTMGKQKLFMKNKIFKILIMMFLFLQSTTSVYCQAPTPTVQLADYSPVEIEGEWKIMQGDSPDFKNIDYDDSTWQSIQVPSNVQKIVPNSSGYIWYRKWIYISPERPVYNMGLRLGKIATTDETFINGYMIGSSGSPDANSLDNEKIRIYQIPDSILHFGEYNLLTVRVRQVYNDTSGIYSETVSIGDYSTLVNQLIRAEATGLIFSGIFILLGCLSIFYLAKKQGAKEYLFLAIGTFSMAIYTFYITQWRYILGVELIYDFRLFYAASFSAMPAFLRFTYESLHEGDTEHESKIEKIFNFFSQGFIMYGAFINSLLLIYNDKPFWRYADKFINEYIALSAGCIGIIYLFYKAATGDKDAKVIAFASVIAFFFGFLELVVLNLDLPKNIAMWGLMIFVLLLMTVLTNRFFRLQKQVEQYSTGLEKMLDKRTEQMKLMEDSRYRL